jgi:hypothetical protein
MALMGEVLEAVTMKVTIFWDLASCSLVDLNSHFRDPSALI